MSSRYIGIIKNVNDNNQKAIKTNIGAQDISKNTISLFKYIGR